MKPTSLTSTLSIYFIKFICIAWSGWVILDYLVHHPYSTHAIVTIPYASLLIFLSAIGLGTSYFLYFKQKKSPKFIVKFPIRGIGLFVIVQLFASFILAAYTSSVSMPSGHFADRVLYFLLLSTLLFLAFLLIVTWAYAIGNLFFRQLKLWYDKSYSLICIALGFSIIGGVLCILGFFQFTSGSYYMVSFC